MATSSKYVGFGTRLLAHNIDLLPIILLLYSITFFLPQSRHDWIMFVCLYVLYHMGFEVSKWHATPGKKLMKIYIDHVDDKKLMFWQILIRNLSKPLSLLLFFSGFIMIIFNQKRRSLHDFLAKTIVLFDRQ